jgi:4-alpha-glucanotransferase
MKLRFSIEYGTEWGECLHVVLTTCCIDRTTSVRRLPMSTHDGRSWTLETAVLESRQRPLASIHYCYEVVNAEGNVQRREWTLVPRIYWVSSSASYVFTDRWRDAPLCAHLYSYAYLTSQHQAFDEEIAPYRVSLYRKTLLLRVSAPQLQKGQSVAVLGSHPAMGCWNETRYLRMEYIGLGDWLLSINMDAVFLPVEYKYVVVDDATKGLVAWEDGDNHHVDAGQEHAGPSVLHDGETRVCYDGILRIAESLWRVAGVTVPLFSLRSEHSFGVGDFGDLRLLVDWAAATGMHIIQLLPINDTTTDGHWHDSNPYKITSCFRLHPHYLDLRQLGELRSKEKMMVYRRRQRELNALSCYDYEAVGRVKGEYVRDFFAERGEQVLKSDGFKEWSKKNAEWLKTDTLSSLDLFVQYQLHLQLKAVADYARQKGVSLKGDLPISMNVKEGISTFHDELIAHQCSIGTPPDAYSLQGQNWGVPPFNFAPSTLTYHQQRLRWMEQYFDAVRIDHILGFFRTWVIPEDAVLALLGHFSPALPMTAGEIVYFGLPFRRELMTEPYINDRVLDRLFGLHASYVRDTFLTSKGYGLYSVKHDYGTQRKVMAFFEGRNDENSLWIRDGLLRLLANVLFVEDLAQPEFYHPRFMSYKDSVFEALNDNDREAYMRLYNHYFFQRHSMYWGRVGMRRLGDMLSGTRLLVCGEDLGMMPDCVRPVLDALRILTLELQSLPKDHGYEFSHLNANPYRSVATIETHDMPPLRMWWEENPDRTQRYYVTMLQKEGRAPEHLPAHLAEEIIARHLYSPSMLCVLSLQDWLSMDSELRRRQLREERINLPGDSNNRWQYRMHLSLEQLLDEEHYNQKIRSMIVRSRRA